MTHKFTELFGVLKGGNQGEKVGSSSMEINVQDLAEVTKDAGDIVRTVIADGHARGAEIASQEGGWGLTMKSPDGAFDYSVTVHMTKKWY